MLCHIVASSAEAETSGVLHYSQVAIPVRYIITQIGHTQPATPLKTDNGTVNLISLKRRKNCGICCSIGCVKNNKSIILTSIGMLVTMTLLIITWIFTQLNITKTSEKICIRQIKLHAITICELHAGTHAARVCWDETVCPLYDDVIMTRFLWHG